MSNAVTSRPCGRPGLVDVVALDPGEVAVLSRCQPLHAMLQRQRQKEHRTMSASFPRDLFVQYAIGAGLISLVDKLLDQQRDSPGFAEQFEEIASQIRLEAKNVEFPVTMPIDDQTYAMTEVIDHFEELLARWRRKLGDDEISR